MAKKTRTTEESQTTPSPAQSQPASAQSQPSQTASKDKKRATETTPVVPPPTPVASSQTQAQAQAQAQAQESSGEQPTQTPETVTQSLFDQSLEFNTEFQRIMSDLILLRNKFKKLEKDWNRELKSAKKHKRGKDKKSSAAYDQCEFIKPTKITDELASFLGLAAGSEISRAESTKAIDKYVKAHKLQNPENGRIIFPDKNLSDLLQIPEGTELTYFNLQKHLAKCFLKSPKAAKSSESSTAAV